MQLLLLAQFIVALT